MAKRARVKVKSPAMTRAQAVADFDRKKARQRRQQVKRRVMIGAGVTMISYVVISSWWSIHTGRMQESFAQTELGFWNQTAKLGFRIDQITLTGRKHADAASVKEALNVNQGDPILAVSLQEMKDRLQNVPEIHEVQITRRLPNQLDVAITERIPVAWWQKQGVQRLIDAEGVVLNREKYPGKLALPVVVGADAPKHMDEFVALMATAPSIKPDVVAAVRVGERRWNVQLTRDIVVMLPEENPQGAWKRFATLVEKEALLSKAIRSVDMRMEDRVFIMPLEQERSPITLTSAQDT